MSISISLTSAGAIPDLDALTVHAQDWLDRDDLAAKIPTFIAMAEALFNREIRASEMERTITFTATAEDTPQPAQDYLAMRSIYLEASPDTPLRSMSPTALKREFDGTSGTPVAFSMVSGGIRLAPPPANATTFTMDYWARIAPLSVIAPSNWLLENHPDAYLYALLFYAEMFLDNKEKAADYKGLLDEVIAQINREANNDRYGAGPLIPNAVAQVSGARC
jgi:hypothetical protein